MITKNEVVEIGKAFSKVVRAKHFPHLSEWDWFENEKNKGLFQLYDFEFGQKEPIKGQVVMVTNRMFFGTHPVQPQFSMQLRKEREEDYVQIMFGFEAWETDAEFCESVFNEFVAFVEAEGCDWLIGTLPVNEKCVKGKPFKLIPTGEKSRHMIQTFLQQNHVRDYLGMVMVQEQRHLIHDIEKLQLATYQRGSTLFKPNYQIVNLSDLI